MIHCDWNNITSTRFTICHVSHCEKYCPYAISDSNNTNHNMPILSCITKTLYSIIQNKQPIKSIPTFIITRNKNNKKIVMLLVHSYTIWSSLMFKINHIFQINNAFSKKKSTIIIHIFNWPKSSTINLQKLTKKKQIRGNKVPNDGDSDEAQSELRRRRGREAEMSVSEWAMTAREWLRLWDRTKVERWRSGLSKNDGGTRVERR